VSFKDSGLHYLVLDEVDNVTAEAQQYLKAIMNCRRVVFIMTKNHILKVDAVIKRRLYLIQVDAATPNDLPGESWSLYRQMLANHARQKVTFI
jgi:hypothetical protein